MMTTKSKIILLSIIAAFVFASNLHAQDTSVNPPTGVKFYEHDKNIFAEVALLLTLPASGDQIIYKDKPLSAKGFADLMKWYNETHAPSMAHAYIKADENLSFEKLVDVLKRLRRNKVDEIWLVVNSDQDYEPPISAYTEGGKRGSVLKIKLPSAPLVQKVAPRPNPLFLLVSANRGGGLMLNNINMTAESIQKSLAYVFKDRENNGVFREGTNEVVQEVHLKVHALTPYGEVVKLIDLLKSVGSHHIYLQIDEETPLKRSRKPEKFDENDDAPPPPPPPVKRKPGI